MASSTQKAGRKRKLGHDESAQSSNARKRQRNQDARAIPVQPPSAAVSAVGDLNISSFIKSREFEIGALEKSMRKARKSLSARAFQQVPRHMRRRTASHNANKVPRRLRPRAQREMKEDNTPAVTKRKRTPSRKLRLRLDAARILKRLNRTRKTVRQMKKEEKANVQQPDPEKHVLTSRVPRLKKNNLAEAPRAMTKYKRRQVNKTWLPTHLWHTKRAHLTRPTEPLWRMAIPLSPTEKSYRPSHRAAGAQGCVAWDVSYMATIVCWGIETALDSMLKALGFAPQGLSQAMQKKWKAGTRFASGWVSERDGERRPIAAVTVLWFQREKREDASPTADTVDVMDRDKPSQDGLVNAEQAQPAGERMQVEDANPAQGSKQSTKRKTKLDHQIMIRIHPAAFHQFWQELLKVAKMQKPQVLVEDLRFEIGSIEIQGPGSTEALLGILRPFPSGGEADDSNASSWTGLTGLNNPSILPQNAMLSFSVVDPRLNHPPKQIQIPKSSESSHLDELLVSWLPNNIPRPSPLLSNKTRWLTSMSLPSQKAINRRRALAPPGQRPAVTPKDPRIPVILIASRAVNSTSKNAQGIWSVILPWSAVDLVWRSLMHYPLSSGGTPRFGGLNQKQQLAFEQKTPWFPGDQAGTEAGKAWERTESEKRFDRWIRRPSRNRIAWDTLDLGLGRRGELGRGWACDWEYLFCDTQHIHAEGVASKADSINQGSAQNEAPRLVTQRQRKASKAKEAEETEKHARRRNTSSPESVAEPEKTPEPIPEVKYRQFSPSQTLSLLKKPSLSTLPQNPALMTVRITLLDKGSPTPAARVYRLPSIPKPNTMPPPNLPPASGTGKSQDSEPPSWPSDGPPPAQPLPTASTTASSTSLSNSALQARDLRARWFAMDPHSSSTNKARQKVKTNKFNIPSHQAAYPRESLAKINVLPKNAPQEIVDKWGPDSAFGRGDGEIPKQMPPPPNETGPKRRNRMGKRKGTAKDNGPALETENPHLNPLDQPAPTTKDMEELFINPFAQPTEWDKHPPCPDPHDLIGFVTSGGYNLAEGRGTAIAGLWVQRVLQGWEVEDNDGGSERDRERRGRLCVVRNAGESVGRLGVWEACG